MSIKSPIFAISSSNDSGYSAVFKQNGFDKPLAIYGHNLDNLQHEEVVLQSPFTNQHVGGLQHRHLPINQGSDSKTNRIEGMALEVSGGSIYVANPQNSQITTASPSNNKNIPYSQIGRNVWTKRPINIANIQYTTASSFIGNFAKTYEFYQANDRATNNSAFVGRGGYNTQFANSIYVSGAYDTPLPNRAMVNGTYNESVIVEKFSAPGGPEVMSEGFLDVETGQYSVYNALPYRNSAVRSALQYLLSLPRDIFTGYQSGSTVTASFHKVNQNPRRVLSYRDSLRTVYVSSSEYDNEFVVHSIPRSDSQYTWITASINTRNDNSTLYFMNVLSMSITNERTSSYDGINSFDGWSTWRQIRNSERTSATYLRKNNMFASSIGNAATNTNMNDTSVAQQNLRNYVFTIVDQKYISPITVKYKPISIILDSLERLRA